MSIQARFALSAVLIFAAALAGRVPNVRAEDGGRIETEAEVDVDLGLDGRGDGQTDGKAEPVKPTPAPTPTPPPTPYYPTTNPWADPVLPLAPKAPAIYGTYNRGCAVGLHAIPVTHKHWELVNDARNRYYAHPDLIRIFERVAAWSVDQARLGKLVAGDFAQPLGGPMTDGHNSHQIGLDGDIRFKFFPADKTMTVRQKKGFAEVDVADYYITKSIFGNVGLVARLTSAWKDDYGRVLEQFATESRIERIFVSPAIKRRMCELYGVPVPTPTPSPTPAPTPLEPGATPMPMPDPTPVPPVKKNYPSWLAKLRPILGHTAHFHIRVACPKGMKSCESQGGIPIEESDASGVECEGPRLQYWFETDPKKNGFLREWIRDNMPAPKPTPTPAPAPEPVAPAPKKPQGNGGLQDSVSVVRFDDHAGHAALHERLNGLEIFARKKPKPAPTPTPVPPPEPTPEVTPTPVPTPKPAPTPKPPPPPRWRTVTDKLPKECKKLIRWGLPDVVTPQKH